MGDRIFVAIMPPASVVDALVTLIEPRRDADPDLRWTPAHQWHLTLAFIPDSPPPLTDALTGSLAEVAGRTPPFTIGLEGGGCVPHPEAARLLYLGVTGDTASLGRVARRSRVAAERLGIEVDGGRFRPHLTVARGRRPLQARRWLTILDSFPPLSWPVDEIVLMKSTLHPSGAEHRQLGSWTLLGRAPLT